MRHQNDINSRSASNLIKILIALCLLCGLIIPAQCNVVLTLKANGNNKSYDKKYSSFVSPLLSQQLSIRGGDIVHLNTMEETEKVVIDNENHDEQLVVIYFSSTNCPPCKRVAPLFVELSEEYEDMGDKMVFCKVDVDENPYAATKYQVTGWPTFLFLKKGEKVMEIVGGNLAEATLFDWVKLMAPKEKQEKSNNEEEE